MCLCVICALLGTSLVTSYPLWIQGFLRSFLPSSWCEYFTNLLSFSTTVMTALEKVWRVNFKKDDSKSISKSMLQKTRGLKGGKTELQWNVISLVIYGQYISLSRNFNSDYLSCDCGMRWVPSFFRSNSARLGDETLCAYPRSLRGKPLRELRESHLNCGKRAAVRHVNEAVCHFISLSIVLRMTAVEQD